MDIADKIALVTGGASGLGEATARRFAALGARVALLDLNDARGQALAEALGPQAMYLRTDVTDEASVRAALERIVQRHGTVHLCCNFAGVADAARTLGKDGPCPLASFQKVVAINLIGTFNVLRLAAAQMAGNEPDAASGDRGVIINTASVAAYEGQIGQAAYAASKGGVVSMTLPIARDLARHRIRVNTLAPGLIHTPMFDALAPEAIRSLSDSPLHPQRLGRPDEVAHLAQFIVENDYLNGETIRLDAGIRMQPR